MWRVLNLGAGVQSTTLLLMSIRGEIAQLDHAIFADTGWEPKAVYQHLEWAEAASQRRGHFTSRCASWQHSRRRVDLPSTRQSQSMAFVGHQCQCSLSARTANGA